jgi:hypothetical protein
MTYEEIEKAMALMKDAGRGNINLPLTVAKSLIAKAKAWDRAPKIIKDAAKELERTPP